MDSSDDESYAGSAASIAAERDRGDAQVVTAVQQAFDPLPMDRAIVVEAQHSGLLNAVSQDLLRLTSEAEGLCAERTAQLAAMNSLVKKTEANLDWLLARTDALAKKKKGSNPIEYAQAESKILDNEDL